MIVDSLMCCVFLCELAHIGVAIMYGVYFMLVILRLLKFVDAIAFNEISTV